MNLLNFGCRRSDFIVSPANYKELKRDNKKLQWFVMCRFYEPEQKVFVFKKKVFSSLSLKEKKMSIPIIIDQMRNSLDRLDYNPRTKSYMFAAKGLNPDMYFIEALHETLKNKEATKGFKGCTETYLRKTESAAKKLKLEFLKIRDVELFHIKNIIQEGSVSNRDFNGMKKHLSTLFTDLVDENCLKINPCTGIKSKPHTVAVKKVFTDEELKYVYQYILEFKPLFANYFQIFLMSGSRNSEILQLQKKDVNLEKREFKILLKKGSQNKWVTRPIYDAAVSFWESQLALCKSSEDFLFGAKFLPNTKSKLRNSVYLYWRTNIMKKLNTDVTIYALKHYFLDKLDEANYNAGLSAGHKNREITALYTVGKQKRELEYLKSIDFKNPTL